MIRYRNYLFVAMTTLTYLVGCSPAPPAAPVVDAEATYADLPTTKIISPEPNLEPVSLAQGDATDSDFWEVIEHNEDGSTHVHVYVVNYEERIKTRSVVNGSGQSWDETYSVSVPMEEIHCVTVPAGVDVRDYIEERYPPLDEPIEAPQPMDFVPDAPPAAD